ncbi:MAG: hypothetical protein ACHQ4J_00910 [Candidatus Binatia bacterium]
MASTRRSRNGNGATNGDNNHARKKRTARAAQVDLSTADLKHLAKAPADYHEIAHKFADALELTKFRGVVSAQKLRRMVARGQSLAQRAAAAQIKAVAADRRRMLQDSQAWKSMLSNWRLVVAAMPDRPDLEAPFAFMQAYMSVARSTPPAPTATPAS